jgi:hypothetical protein
MKNAPAFLPTLSVSASVNMTKKEPNNAYQPVIAASSPDIMVGKSNCPIPRERLASTRELPMMSPIASSYCLLRRAVKSTTSSGRDVLIATMKKLIRYSEIFSALQLYHHVSKISSKTLEELAVAMLKQLKIVGQKHVKDMALEDAELLKVKIYTEALASLTKQKEWCSLFQA